MKNDNDNTAHQSPNQPFSENVDNLPEKYSYVKQNKTPMYLSKTRAVAPAPKVIHHGLWGGEEVPSPGEHASRHGDLFSKKRVPQARVERHLYGGMERPGKHLE